MRVCVACVCAKRRESAREGNAWVFWRQKGRNAPKRNAGASAGCVTSHPIYYNTTQRQRDFFSFFFLILRRMGKIKLKLPHFHVSEEAGPRQWKRWKILPGKIRGTRWTTKFTYRCRVTYTRAHTDWKSPAKSPSAWRYFLGNKIYTRYSGSIG